MELNLLQVLKDGHYWELLPLKLEASRYRHCAATFRYFVLILIPILHQNQNQSHRYWKKESLLPPLPAQQCG
jgi:hypothetical protein